MILIATVPEFSGIAESTLIRAMETEAKSLRTGTIDVDVFITQVAALARQSFFHDLGNGCLVLIPRQTQVPGPYTLGSKWDAFTHIFREAFCTVTGRHAGRDLFTPGFCKDVAELARVRIEASVAEGCLLLPASFQNICITPQADGTPQPVASVSSASTTGTVAAPPALLEHSFPVIPVAATTARPKPTSPHQTPTPVVTPAAPVSVAVKKSSKDTDPAVAAARPPQHRKVQQVLHPVPMPLPVPVVAPTPAPKLSAAAATTTTTPSPSSSSAPPPRKKKQPTPAPVAPHAKSGDLSAASSPLADVGGQCPVWLANVETDARFAPYRGEGIVTYTRSLKYVKGSTAIHKATIEGVLVIVCRTIQHVPNTEIPAGLVVYDETRRVYFIPDDGPRERLHWLVLGQIYGSSDGTPFMATFLIATAAEALAGDAFPHAVDMSLYQYCDELHMYLRKAPDFYRFLPNNVSIVSGGAASFYNPPARQKVLLHKAALNKSPFEFGVSPHQLLRQASVDLAPPPMPHRKQSVKRKLPSREAAGAAPEGNPTRKKRAKKPKAKGAARFVDLEAEEDTDDEEVEADADSDGGECKQRVEDDDELADGESDGGGLDDDADAAEPDEEEEGVEEEEAFDD